MEKYTVFMDWKNQHCQNGCLFCTLGYNSLYFVACIVPVLGIEALSLSYCVLQHNVDGLWFYFCIF